MLVTQIWWQKNFYHDEQTMINPDCMDLRIADEFSKIRYESHVNKLHIVIKKFKILVQLSEEYLNEPTDAFY